MLSSNDSVRVRMRVLFLLVPLLLAGLLVRFYVVQIVRHEELLEKARKKYTAIKVTTGLRGEIFDREGHLLVGNQPCVDIAVDPSEIKDDTRRKTVSFLLARELKLDPAEVAGKVRPRVYRNAAGKERPVRYSVVKRDVTLDDSAGLRKLMQTIKMREVILTESTRRYYPNGILLANILGFTSLDRDKPKPVTGLERYFDDKITSTTGTETYERDRIGYPLSYGNFESEAFRNGKNIYLTIREPLQAILEEELTAAWQEWKPKAVYAVMAEPVTGEILAIAQRPSFDPNNRASITADAWRNRITEDTFEPGSIMKPFSIAEAIDLGVVTPETMVDCEKGVWFYRGKAMTDSHKAGKVTVTDVIKTSSNIGTAKVALLLGEKRVYYALRKFGFGTYSGIPLSPESRGVLHPVRKWDGLTVTRVPIGYSVQVTPVQIVRAYCALASGGRLRPLRLVDRVVDPATGKVEEAPLAPAWPLFRKADTAEKMSRMLSLVTGEGGTAQKAAIPGYLVAGKTGTSRKYVPGIGYASGKHFGSFVGYVPAQKPAFVLLVTLDEPQGRYYGGTVAAPVFRRIAERALKFLNVPPTEPLPEPKTEKKRR
ncbi:MAG: penicillin-binding protein 2 [Victivallaceae bacterium]|nr:penicillin-binding protein 2 [Victivallaceae bacterium]